MGEYAKHISFRASDDVRGMLSDLQAKLRYKRSWVIETAIRALWLLMFEIESLKAFIDGWQEFNRVKSGHNCDTRALQLRLNFDQHCWTPMFPKFGPRRVPGFMSEEKAS